MAESALSDLVESDAPKATYLEVTVYSSGHRDYVNSGFEIGR